MTDKKEEMLTIRDLQAVLRCGRTTAYSLVSKRLIPATRVGRSLRIRRSDLEAFIEHNQY
jgi:excisionase family DNA binding protein